MVQYHPHRHQHHCGVGRELGLTVFCVRSPPVSEGGGFIFFPPSTDCGRMPNRMKISLAQILPCRDFGEGRCLAVYLPYGWWNGTHGKRIKRTSVGFVECWKVEKLCGKHFEFCEVCVCMIDGLEWFLLVVFYRGISWKTAGYNVCGAQSKTKLCLLFHRIPRYLEGS